MKKHLFLALMLAVGGGTMAQTPPNYHLLKKTVIGGEGGWDYLLADPMGGHLYLSQSTQVEVLDLKTHQKIGTIAPTPGIHGIAVVNEAGVGYTTN